MKNLEDILANPAENTDILALSDKYLDIQKELEVKTEEWTGLMEKTDQK